MAKKILITGASSGIGKALAYEFAARGYTLALTARRLEVLEETKRDLQVKTGGALTVEVRRMDVNDQANVFEVIKELAGLLNGLDVVVVNAGITGKCKTGAGDYPRSLEVIQTNLLGAMHTIEVAVETFREYGKGHLVGISSVASFRGLPLFAAYCASKAALNVYLEAVRSELFEQKIDVSILKPGFIETPLVKGMKKPPFMIGVDKAAVLMADMIEAKVKSSTVPRMPWSVISKVMKMVPEAVISKLK